MTLKNITQDKGELQKNMAIKKSRSTSWQENCNFEVSTSQIGIRNFL